MVKRTLGMEETQPVRDCAEDPAARRIIAAARRRFYAFGFRRVTMDDLAEELGMSKKTLYGRFPGKKALVEAVILDKLHEIEADLDRVMSDRPSAFHPQFRQMLAVIQQHMEEVQPSFMRDIQSEPELFKMVEIKRNELLMQYFGKILKEGQEKGVIRRDVHAGLIMEILLGAIRSIINPAKTAELDITAGAGLTAILGVILEGIVTKEWRLKQ